MCLGCLLTAYFSLFDYVYFRCYLYLDELREGKHYLPDCAPHELECQCLCVCVCESVIWIYIHWKRNLMLFDSMILLIIHCVHSGKKQHQNPTINSKENSYDDERKRKNIIYSLKLWFFWGQLFRDDFWKNLGCTKFLIYFLLSSQFVPKSIL